MTLAVREDSPFEPGWRPSLHGASFKGRNGRGGRPAVGGQALCHARRQGGLLARPRQGSRATLPRPGPGEQRDRRAEGQNKSAWNLVVNFIPSDLPFSCHAKPYNADCSGLKWILMLLVWALEGGTDVSVSASLFLMDLHAFDNAPQNAQQCKITRT